MGLDYTAAPHQSRMDANGSQLVPRPERFPLPSSIIYRRDARPAFAAAISNWEVLPMES
jgi:uncharacterized protein YbjT (DUF2867 family)